jgi:hypothetical protein
MRCKTGLPSHPTGAFAPIHNKTSSLDNKFFCPFSGHFGGNVPKMDPEGWKTGILEWWNGGMMLEERSRTRPPHPLFHYSKGPLFQNFNLPILFGTKGACLWSD